MTSCISKNALLGKQSTTRMEKTKLIEQYTITWLEFGKLS